MLKLIKNCIFSPRLYLVHGLGPDAGRYEPFLPEHFANIIITTVRTIASVGIYTTPFIFMYIYKRGFFSWCETRYLSCASVVFGCFTVFIYLMRAIGRACNPIYVQFLNTLNAPIDDERVYFRRLRKYDFEFNAWPPSFEMQQIPRTSWFDNTPFARCANPELPCILRVPIQLLAYASINTFALRLIYPGSLTFIQNMLWNSLIDGRNYIVDMYSGKRAKIIAADGNSIDTMFVDSRIDSPKGNILVICSEGNSGFYEIGIMSVVFKAGYSALGWNHPGFCGSTGTPYPRQEQNAIDAVVQYALNELNFDIDDIVFFGWSIGGYASTWAAINYPEAQGLVLDACFDDLLVLAQNQMPSSWSRLVREVIRSFVDLNIAEMLRQYHGPLQLIRRTEDEVICLNPNQPDTNRMNFLLYALLRQRHPSLFVDYEADPERIDEILHSCIFMEENDRQVQSLNETNAFKRRVLGLASAYMHDFHSTHCPLLPEIDFSSLMDLILRPQRLM